jgi:hypothetical protein
MIGRRNNLRHFMLHGKIDLDDNGGRTLIVQPPSVFGITFQFTPLPTLGIITVVVTHRAIRMTPVGAGKTGLQNGEIVIVLAPGTTPVRIRVIT